MSYWILQTASLFTVIVIAAAVGWETLHILEWASELWRQSGDGSLASYLRHHAYTYMEFVFGDSLGWKL